MDIRRLLGVITASSCVVVVAACGQAQAEDAHAAAGEWPPSEVELPGSIADAMDASQFGGSVDLGAPFVFDSTGTAESDRSGAGDSASDELGMGSDVVDTDASGPMVHTPAPIEDFPNARYSRPEHVRGLYVNAWAAGSSKRMSALLDIARRTEINAFVIDIKDATGYVSHETAVPLAHEIGATEERRIRDLPTLLDRLEAEDIYPIARIVVVKDPILSTFRPELAVQDTAGGVWIDSKGIVWLNPYSKGVWDYHVQIAREVAEMGFPEIQWDYIRFPDAPDSDMQRAVFPDSDGRSRAEAIRGFLSYAKESLSDLPVRVAADVFGVTTSFRHDIGLGQLWESFIDVVDVAQPMVYPSHYWEGSFGYRDPNAYPYEVVRAALRDALQRSAKVPGAGLTRPWLQDFTLGEPIYGGAEVRAQIQAAYDVGIQEWILWNPSTRYSESALRPNDGFEYEPLVRVAGVLTPVSRRQIVIDSVAALPPRPDSPAMSDSLVAPDSLMAPDSILAPDSLMAPDSVSAPDSIAGAVVPIGTAGAADTLGAHPRG